MNGLLLQEMDLEIVKETVMLHSIMVMVIMRKVLRNLLIIPFGEMKK